MQRAHLWQQPEKGKHLSPQITSVLKLLRSPIIKSHVVRAAAGGPSDFKTVQMVDLGDISKMIRVKMTRVTAPANAPHKRFQEIDMRLIIVNADLFQHLPQVTMCPL